ncbi:MAG: threonine/serine dehydratase [Candidatus Bathyarchaeota archaeon]|nr:threonine/serine dehydratase [Candidatus Bathyarchaeota archaeon]
MAELAAPTLLDVVAARERIRPYLLRTPLTHYHALSSLLGCEAWVKHENHQPIGAFMIRGGINLLSRMTGEERARGVITASTGNHGQSISYASRLFGARAVVCVQVGANPDKVASMRALGAEIVEWGDEFEDARLHAVDLAEERGLRYIHTANEPDLISGVGTLALEMVEDRPDLDVVIVSAGAGTLSSGVATVYKALSPATRIVAVQTEAAPSLYRSWRSGRVECSETARTLADGLAVRQSFELPVGIVHRLVDDFVLVSEDELRAAIRLYVEKAHTIAEGAGAAPLAAALKMREQLRGKRVGLVLSGGNITAAMLRDILG